MKLIKKEATVNALASFPCSCWVTSLNHKAFNEPMKECAIIVAFQAKLNEVAASSWCLLCPQLDLNVSIVSL